MSAADEWADSPLKVNHYQHTIGGKRYYSVDVTTEHHRLSVSVSPQGRSVRCYLDGVLQTDEPPQIHERGIAKAEP